MFCHYKSYTYKCIYHSNNTKMDKNKIQLPIFMLKVYRGTPPCTLNTFSMWLDYIYHSMILITNCDITNENTQPSQFEIWRRFGIKAKSCILQPSKKGAMTMGTCSMYVEILTSIRKVDLSILTNGDNHKLRQHNNQTNLLSQFVFSWRFGISTRYGELPSSVMVQCHCKRVQCA